MKARCLFSIIACIVSLAATNAHAALVIGEQQFNVGDGLPSPIIAVANDLLQTNLASVTDEGGGNVRNDTTGTAQESSGTNPAQVWGKLKTIYNLDTSVNTAGYNISEIRLFSGWEDSRAGQSYQIWYEPAGETSFIQLGSVSALQSGGSLLTRTYDNTGANILANVQAIEFVQVDNGVVGTGTVFREFDVLGSAAVLTATASWVGGAPGAATDWGTAANWNPSSSVPGGAGTAVSFGSQAEAYGTVDLGASNRTVGGIVLGNTTGTTILSTSGYSLTLDNSGAVATISGAGQHSINTTVILNSPLAVTLTGGTDQLTLGGSVNAGSGSNGITFHGAGTLILSASNSYSGDTTINGGTLTVGHNLAVQNSTVSVGAGALNFAHNITAPVLGGLSGAGNINLATVTAQPVTLHVGNNGADTTYRGSLSGSGGLTKVGNGVLTIAASHNYTGPTTVNGGTLRLLGSTLLADNLQSTTLNSNNWTTYTSANGGRGSVTATGSGVNLYARGYLNTLNQYDPAQTGGLVITGNWVFTTNTSDYDLMQIVEHSSGVGGGDYGETTNGVEFNFRENTTVPTLGGDGNYEITTDTSSGNLSVSNGDNLWFRCVDDGSGHLSFLVKDLTNSTSGSATGTITAGTATNNYITFHNRELGYTSQLSNVVITSLSGGGSLPTATAATVSASATLDLNGVNQTVASLSDYSPGNGGNVTNGGSSGATLTISGGSSATFSGVISDGLGKTALAISGGTLMLSGGNTYSGSTSVTAGILRGGARDSFSPNSDVMVTDGVLDTGPYQQTVNSLTIGSFGKLDLYVNHILSVNGDVILDPGSTLNLHDLHGGTTILMTYGGSLTGTFNATLPTGYSLSYATSGQIDLIGGAISAAWAFAESGSWSEASKWEGDSVPAAGAAIVINQPITTPNTQLEIKLDGQRNVSSLALGNASDATSGYLLSGTDTLTFQSTTGTATIAVTDGKHEIAAPVDLASELSISSSSVLTISSSISETGSHSLTLNGTGTLVLSGTGLYTGGTIVNAGTLAVTTSTALPDNQSLTVGAGGTLIFDPSFSASPIMGTPVSAFAASSAGSPVSPVPEPSTLALLFAGLVMGYGIWRRKGAASCRAVWRTS